ncbi:zinc-binding dehydrogenase [Paenibacillus polysaccharolyticus]
MFAAVEQSNLKPAIDSIYDIDNIQDAFSRLSSGGKFGKIYVRVAR